MHDAELRDTRFSFPQAVFELPPAERANRASWAEDWCMLDGWSPVVRCFVRGLLKLTVRQEDDYFRYGVWVEVTQPDFDVLVEHWFDPDCAELPIFFGRLANELNPYRGTLGLEVALQMLDAEQLPDLSFVSGRHELIRAHQSGIDRRRLTEIVAAVSH